jgi:hypothetical protein
MIRWASDSVEKHFREVMAMVSKTVDDASPGRSGPGSFLQPGNPPTDAMLRLQKELLEAYEQANRAWVARVKSEIDLWSGLASRMATIRSAPEAMQAYQECLAERMQMGAEDGRRVAKQCEEVMQRITRSFSNGWPTASS